MPRILLFYYIFCLHKIEIKGVASVNPSELIDFLLLGLVLLLVIVAVWYIFRKRKKWVIAITAVLVSGYMGYYFYLPTLKANTHAAKYEQIIEYLDSNYPDRQFTVRPERYEPGYYVGTFDINDKETPEMGVTLQVKDNGDVIQTGYWEDGNFPSQQDLWKTLNLSYLKDYSLDSEKVEITKQDEWIDGELTVFALMIDGNPSIAVFNYSQAGYSWDDLQESQNGNFVAAETEDHVFVFIDETYTGETVEVELQNGATISVDAAEHKGELFVTEQ